MDVPKELLEKWIALRGHGDPKDIIESMEEKDRVVPETIRRVYKDGRCSDEVYKAMAEFYDQREALLSKYVSATKV